MHRRIAHPLLNSDGLQSDLVCQPIFHNYCNNIPAGSTLKHVCFDTVNDISSITLLLSLSAVPFVSFPHNFRFVFWDIIYFDILEGNLNLTCGKSDTFV